MSNWFRSKEEILEYPYTGTITSVISGNGMDEDTEEVLYEGVMDENMRSAENGNVMQTSNYIISIPLTRDENNNFIVPKKGDKIEINVYGNTFKLIVDNAEPSQIGGVSIYATRNSW